jgi:hypothetical protein
VPGKRQFHQTSYTLHGHTLDVVDSGKYLGVTINKDLTWTKHINQTIGKASKTLGQPLRFFTILNMFMVHDLNMFQFVFNHKQV